LIYGIPNMKLDKGVLARRITLMEQSGIKFVLNTEIGKDIPASDILESYDALVLCGGATKGRGLDIEGKELKGVHFAIDFLKENTKTLLKSEGTRRPDIDAKGKDVIILGGGDTGTDCVATALRQGCKSVVQFEIMPEPSPERNEITNPWPEWPKKLKVDYGQEEAIELTGKDPRTYLISTQKLVGNENGEVKEAITVQVNWVKDNKGRFSPQIIDGSQKSWHVDLVLLAMGFIGPEDRIAEELKLDRDPRSNYRADYGSFKSNIEKVFTAGDMRRGQSLVVWAIQEGKLAAREVDKYLMGQSNIR